MKSRWFLTKGTNESVSDKREKGVNWVIRAENEADVDRSTGRFVKRLYKNKNWRPNHPSYVTSNTFRTAHTEYHNSVLPASPKMES